MKELIDKIKAGNVILFVGAGVSATLNLPTWSELLAVIAKKMGYDPEIFSMYGEPLVLTEFYEIEKGNLKELTRWMKDSWKPDDRMLRDSSVHQKILELDFPIIYTTNFDNCLERAYQLQKKPFTKIVKVQDICKCKRGKTQIVKLHGDVSNFRNIVLTESNYFDRMNFESPLDIKLRSDILGKSILFIGYSLTDINIRLLLYKLNKLWGNGNKKSQPQSYIFMATPNRIQETVLRSRNITPIIGENVNPTESLDQFLERLLNK